MMWWMALAHAEQEPVQILSADIEWSGVIPIICVKRLYHGRVPVDHNNPDADTMPLHVVKLPAIRSNAEEILYLGRWSGRGLQK